MRVSDWWEDKLAPILGTGYATACFAGAPLLDVAGGLALVLFALIPGAVYVGLLNDLTDREDDRAAGRPDPLAGRSLRVWWAMVAGAVARPSLSWRGGHSSTA
jgi:4-hydroxybenzoate polyprenyltransferase